MIHKMENHIILGINCIMWLNNAINNLGDSKTSTFKNGDEWGWCKWHCFKHMIIMRGYVVAQKRDLGPISLSHVVEKGDLKDIHRIMMVYPLINKRSYRKWPIYS